MKLSDVKKEVARHKNDRFSGISGFNDGKKLGLAYHFIKGKTPLDLTVVFDEKEVVPSISDIFPSASYYETEAHEMLGVKFDRLDRAKLFLAEDWKKKPPLRE